MISTVTPKNKMSFLFQIAVWLIVVYSIATVFVFFFQRRLMYNPYMHVNTPHRHKSPDFEKVVLKTEDGLELASFYKEPLRDKNGILLPTILYLHGNTGTAEDAAHKLIPIVDAGYGALLLEYRGFGSNSGKPTENGLILDAKAALDFIRLKQGKNARVVYYGMSMGTGVANGLAAIASPAGLILECGFTSMTDAARYHYYMFPVKYIIKDTFDSRQRIKTLQSPLLVLHGRQDKTVPVEQGEEMFAIAPVTDKTLKIYPQGGHINLYDFGSSDDITDWLNTRFQPEKE